MNINIFKQYYIFAASQCVRSDAFISLDAMQVMNFIWVQFYNNDDCNIDQFDFNVSFKVWSDDVFVKSAEFRLYIDASDCLICVESKYLKETAMTSQIFSTKESDLSNFEKVMLWDESKTMFNTDSEQNYLTLMKSTLSWFSVHWKRSILRLSFQFLLSFLTTLLHIVLWYFFFPDITT